MLFRSGHDLASGVHDALDGEDAPTDSLNPHLAFGDATVAMLDLATSADKDSRPLHRTEMSCPKALIRAIPAINADHGPAISDR